MREIRAVHMGIGPMGSRMVKYIAEEKDGIRYVGGIDVDPDLVGKDLGEEAGCEEPLGINISNDSEKVFSETDPDIVIQSTVSSFEQAYQQLKIPIEYGVNVVSTCEQLSFPSFTSRDLTEELDSLAKENEVTVLGGGINPGFLMDVRPLILSFGCTKVDGIRVRREMNATPRRKPFQKKIGVSMTLNGFEKAVREGEIGGHVGLEQSISLVANGIGWKLEEIEVEDVEPMIAEEKISSEFFTVEERQVKGVKQKAHGKIDGEKRISLDFRAYLGAEPSYDEVRIDGTPEINAKVSPCWHGDYGTVATITNLIPTVINANPGLMTLNDISPISFKSGDMSKFVNLQSGV